MKTESLMKTEALMNQLTQSDFAYRGSSGHQWNVVVDTQTDSTSWQNVAQDK